MEIQGKPIQVYGYILRELTQESSFFVPVFDDWFIQKRRPRFSGEAVMTFVVTEGGKRAVVLWRM